MNKKLPVLILTGALACAVFSPALAAEKAPTLTPPAAYVEEVQTLPNSVLYYGTLTESSGTRTAPSSSCIWTRSSPANMS